MGTNSRNYSIYQIFDTTTTRTTSCKIEVWVIIIFAKKYSSVFMFNRLNEQLSILPISQMDKLP